MDDKKYLQQQICQSGVLNQLPKEEPGFRDPLGDYCDQASFNILQFLAETDTPGDSPAEALIRGSMNNNNNNDNPEVHRLYQNNSSRLPDSPPITDVSAAGSSGSPSSNSDSPYSPDSYPGYSVLPNGHQNGNGLILGVHDLPPNMIETIPGQVMGGTRLSSQHPSPHQVYMSPYPAQTHPNHAQVSPVGAQLRGQPPPSNQQLYTMVGGGQYEVYNEMISATESAMQQDGVSRKRQRVDPVAQAPAQANYVVNTARQRQNGSTDGQRYAANAANGAVSMAASPVGGESFADENFHQAGEVVIKFSKFAEESWHTLYDEGQRELKNMVVHVVADKGFNYSHTDTCFVNQKKNHFQISVNIEAGDEWPPRYVHNNNNQLVKIKELKLAFCGVKNEMPTSEIQIKQSQTDRKPIPHDPVVIPLIPAKHVTKVTVPRLHFSETTMNNQRKNNRPNPDQKFFLLLVRLLACTEDGQMHLVQAYASERVIVRATNPGQFEPPDSDVAWAKNGSTLFTNGPVAVGMERQMGGAVLNVHGDIYHVGQFLNPSDRRLKENIQPISKDEAMDRMSRFRIVEYAYKPEIANEWGLSEESRHRVGVIAQELAEIIPEAVRDNGEYLTIDESRVFYDNVVVTQELCRLHEDLESKIEGKVENIQKTLGKIFRRKQAALGQKVEENASAETSSSGLGDSKSYLGESRYSLASSFMKERDYVKKHCNNPTCGRGDQMCNTRVTQGTIVTLVAIMAFCLLAMSALYILDWHQRNYGYHKILPPTPPPALKTSTEGIANMIQLPPLPTKQPMAIPIYAVCTHKHCLSYCCADPSRHSLNSDISLIDRGHPLARNRFIAAVAGVSYLAPAAFVPKPLGSEVSIEIVNMNLTIDQRYCYEASCNQKRGRYTLYVPISSYMPTTPITIRFEVPQGRITNNCGYIAELKDEYCSYDQSPIKAEKNTNPSATMVFENTFELSAGRYLKSGYRFRIGYSTESCFSSEDHQLGVYDEYNLIFYRTCAASTNSTAKPK